MCFELLITPSGFCLTSGLSHHALRFPSILLASISFTFAGFSLATISYPRYPKISHWTSFSPSFLALVISRLFSHDFKYHTFILMTLNTIHWHLPNLGLSCLFGLLDLSLQLQACVPSPRELLVGPNSYYYPQIHILTTFKFLIKIHIKLLLIYTCEHALSLLSAHYFLCSTYHQITYNVFHFFPSISLHKSINTIRTGIWDFFFSFISFSVFRTMPAT